MKWIALYLGVYAIALAALAAFENFNVIEPLFVLAVVGGGFTLIAWLLARRATPVAGVTMNAPWWGVVAWLVFLTAVVTWGFSLLPENEWLKAGVKLVVFVIVPVVAFRARFPLRFNRGDAAIVILFLVVLFLFQVVFGNGVRKIAEVGLVGWRLALAAAASFVWMSIEAGIVEEVSFRGILQTRLEQVTGSAAGGIVITALLFGLIHAPGLYLRTGQTNESFTSPSLLYAIGFSIVILSPAGLFLGYLWAKTRNMVVVVLVHGAMDLVPNVVGLARLLGLTEAR